MGKKKKEKTQLLSTPTPPSSSSPQRDQLPCPAGQLQRRPPGRLAREEERRRHDQKGERERKGDENDLCSRGLFLSLSLLSLFHYSPFLLLFFSSGSRERAQKARELALLTKRCRDSRACCTVRKKERGEPSASKTKKNGCQSPENLFGRSSSSALISFCSLSSLLERDRALLMSLKGRSIRVQAHAGERERRSIRFSCSLARSLARSSFHRRSSFLLPLPSLNPDLSLSSLPTPPPQKQNTKQRTPPTPRS